METQEEKFQWKPDTQFVLNGQEFGLVINSLRNFLATPESQRVLFAQSAHESLMEVLKKTIKEP